MADRGQGVCDLLRGAPGDPRRPDQSLPFPRQARPLRPRPARLPTGDRLLAREHTPCIASRKPPAKSLWYENVPDSQRVRPTFQIAFFKTTFASSSPTTPATQSVSAVLEVAAWDISIGPDGVGLPPGNGTPKQGEAIYTSKCVACHGEKGAGKPNDQLVGGQGTLPGDKPPVKTVGSFWPYATTVFDYVRRAMPYNESKSLTNDEIYAVVAYILNLNGIIADNDAMDAQTLRTVKMPNPGPEPG
jgi:mono/diheme cytochrome c family protein